MKVRITRPVRWYTSYDLSNYLATKLNLTDDQQGKLDKTLKYAQPLFRVYNNTRKYLFNTLRDKIEVHKHDVWSVYDTLAPIILKVLLEYRTRNTHSYGFVDPMDAPAYFHPNCFGIDKEGHGFDHGALHRWNWLVDELIWTFQALSDEDWNEQFRSVDYSINMDFNEDRTVNFQTTGKFDHERHAAYDKRIKQGLILFGKYFEHLWI